MKAVKLWVDQGEQQEWIPASVMSSHTEKRGNEREWEDRWSKKGGKRRRERRK